MFMYGAKTGGTGRRFASDAHLELLKLLEDGLDRAPLLPWVHKSK